MDNWFLKKGSARKLGGHRRKIALEHNLIFAEMNDELEKRFIKYSKEHLNYYIEAKIAITKTKTKKDKEQTITYHTLLYWVQCFLAKYTLHGEDWDE